jgi:hypothetical protein
MAIRYVTFKRFTLDNNTPMIQFLGITTYKPCCGQVVPEDMIPVTPLIKDEIELIEVNLENPPLENLDLTAKEVVCNITEVQRTMPCINSVETLFTEVAWRMIESECRATRNSGKYIYTIIGTREESDGYKPTDLPVLKYAGINYDKVENYVRSILTRFKVRNTEGKYVIHPYNKNTPYKATYDNWDELVNDLLDELATEHDLVINYPDWSDNHVKGFLRVFRCPSENLGPMYETPF